MATYYVDDGGDNTTGADWSTAYTSVSALDDARALASGDIVYIGHDHVCQYAHGGARNIICASSLAPVVFISVTQGSSPPTYQIATTANQIDTTEGAYNITFNGCFALLGVSIKSGANINLDADNNETGFLQDVVLTPGANGRVVGPTGFSVPNTRIIGKTITIDLTQDSGASSNPVIEATGGMLEIDGLTVLNGSNRTGVFFNGSVGVLRLSGADVSSLTHGSLELFSYPCPEENFANNLLTHSTWTPRESTVPTSGSSDVIITNAGSADSPTYIYKSNRWGILVSTAAIYRDNGATVEDANTGWSVTTTSVATEEQYFITPPIYGVVDSTGSKTFDVFITNDTADFTDAEVWLEVEYLGTASEAEWVLADDHRVRTTTAAVQTDDTTSTWTGTGPSFTYKQKLSVTATVNQTGLYRVRVCVGLASIAAARYFYIDPLVTVT